MHDQGALDKVIADIETGTGAPALVPPKEFIASASAGGAVRI